MVRLRTLDPPIGVRLPASQPHLVNDLRSASTLAVFVLCAYFVPPVPNSIFSSLSVATCCLEGRRWE